MQVIFSARIFLCVPILSWRKSLQSFLRKSNPTGPAELAASLIILPLGQGCGPGLGISQLACMCQGWELALRYSS